MSKYFFRTALVSFVFCIIILFGVNVASARIGVGVGTGKIIVDEKLKSGIIYNLPTITVLNTGDESSEYSIRIAYHQDQKEIPPSKEWFIFSPEKFRLEPGGAQEVKITLSIPLKTKPGDYFAYIEGFPLSKSTIESTTVGIAAASKLYFTIDPTNIWEGIYYRVTSLWIRYFPWTYIFVGLLSLILIGIYTKSKLKISISVKNTAKESESEHKPSL